MSGQNFVLHDAAGRVRGQGACPLGEVQAQSHGNLTALNVPGMLEDMEAWHVSGEEVLPRVLPDVQVYAEGFRGNGEDAATLSGLPIPCVVRIDGDAHEVTDGELEIAVDVPGTYVVEVEAFPWLTLRLELEAKP